MPKQDGITFSDPEPEPDPIERKDLDKPKDLEKAPKGDEPKTAPIYQGDLDKYKGKTAEELVAMLEDQHTYIGKISSERDKYKGDLEFGQRLQQAARTEQPPVTSQDDVTPTDEDDDGYVSRSDMKQTVKSAIEADRKIRIAESQQKLSTMAAYAHEEGKASLAKNPELYNGIEKETELGVFQTLKPYLDAGYDISGYLRDSATWERVGRQIRFNRGEYEILQRADGKKKPATAATVQPSHGEVPTSGRALEDLDESGDKVKIDAKGRYIMDYFGLTEEEAIEGVKTARKERG